MARPAASAAHAAARGVDHGRLIRSTKTCSNLGMSTSMCTVDGTQVRGRVEVALPLRRVRRLGTAVRLEERGTPSGGLQTTVWPYFGPRVMSASR